MPRFTSPLAVLSLVPVAAFAQESSADTSHFRAGQWGLQFGTSGVSLVNLGILRFTSPRAAWMLLLDFNGEFLNGTQTSLGTTSDQNSRMVDLGVGLGKRFYQAPRHKVRSFQSIGVAASYSDNKQTLGGTTFKVNQSRAGVLGELGAGYWVTPNLSLGGTASLFGGYSHR
ncbi:MAG: autotransporter outer membrane beta-barrel domain-containing protein, partial [Hyphomicrobiaceae bacterium]|nr:autotransporter outer membrane beta-barrel domain-containing protein [Hyphomicrobiaceae bacterium]